MAKEPENPVFERLRRMREQNATFRSEVKEEIGDPKLRLGAMEQASGSSQMLMTAQLNAVQSGIGQIRVSMGSYHRRTDRLETREDSFESRPDRLEQLLKAEKA